MRGFKRGFGFCGVVFLRKRFKNGHAPPVLLGFRLPQPGSLRAGAGMSLVTRSEFARLCNVNRATVTRWVQSGRIQSAPDGRIDAEAAVRMREATESPLPQHQARKAQLDEAKQAQTWGESGDDDSSADDLAGMPALEKLGAAYKLETYRLQKAKAETANVELERLKGSLIAREVVEYVLMDVGATLVSMTESRADYLAGDILTLGQDFAAIHKRLSDDLRDLCVAISDHMQRRMERA